MDYKEIKLGTNIECAFQADDVSDNNINNTHIEQDETTSSKQKTGNQLSIQKIENVLLSDAELDLGYQQRIFIEQKFLQNLQNPNTSGEDAVSRKSSSGYKFKKTYDNTLSESLVNSFGVKMKSVGALVCKKELGTVFRVGSRYVMTACHVVQEITGKLNDVSALQRSNVFVNFNESLVEQGGLIYRLTDYLLWDLELDFAVLEISNPDDLLPPGLPLCFDESNYNQVSFIGYGHPNKSGKYLDPRCNILTPDSDKTSRAREWLDEQSPTLRSIFKRTAKHPSIVGLVDTAYEGLNHPDKLIFDCFMHKGGSGSPALTNDDADSIQVVGILTHELPEFYFCLDDTKRRMIKDEYRFEMGPKMSSILKCINKKDKKLASNLCS